MVSDLLFGLVFPSRHRRSFRSYRRQRQQVIRFSLICLPHASIRTVYLTVPRLTEESLNGKPLKLTLLQRRSALITKKIPRLFFFLDAVRQGNALHTLR